jgi:hypothetical protein
MCILQHRQTAKHRPRSSLCWPPIMHHSRPKHPLNTDQPTNVTGVVQRRRADMHQPDQIVSLSHAPGGVVHVCIPQLPCTTHQSKYTGYDMFPSSPYYCFRVALLWRCLRGITTSIFNTKDSTTSVILDITCGTYASRLCSERGQTRRSKVIHIVQHDISITLVF